MASFEGASMSIKIVGSPDKNFTPYVHRAAKFYADSLLTKQMQDYTSIVIKFKKDMPVSYTHLTLPTNREV